MGVRFDSFLKGDEMPEEPCLRQSSVVPIRLKDDGFEFCLVTSRTKQQWIFPKGQVEPSETEGQAALKEAYEEAGLEGHLLGAPLGIYSGCKLGHRTAVTVFLMEIERSLKRWPECHQRKRCFVSFSQAKGMLRKPALKEVLKIVNKRFSF